jgi:hypothetical protein
MQSITLNGKLECVELVVDGVTISLADAFRIVEAERAKNTTFEKTPYTTATMNILRGDRTKAAFKAMFDLAEKNGEVTLAEVATRTNESLDSVRAHLRNGRRTMKARGWDFPFSDNWNHDRNCMVYTLRADA